MHVLPQCVMSLNLLYYSLFILLNITIKIISFLKRNTYEIISGKQKCTTFMVIFVVVPVVAVIVPIMRNAIICRLLSNIKQTK